MEQLKTFSEKKNLLVSFSGGETSAYMAQWLWKNKQEEYNIVFVFANTGLENYETIYFIKRVSEYFGFTTHIIEAVINPEKGIGATYREVFQMGKTYMEGEPFIEMCKKFGLPNMASPHCTRELKQVPIEKFAKDYFKGKPYYTAIGIRSDEIDRMSVRKKERKLIYPLISDVEMTKKKINFFWKMQPFRLELKGYEGNCVFCWKKSDKKLALLERERGHYALNVMGFGIEFEFAEHYVNKKLENPIRMYRGNKSLHDIINQFRGKEINIKDEAGEYESCDVFTACGIDN